MSMARILSKLGALLNSSGQVPQAALAANVAGNGPSFRAYQTTNQALGANANTKIVLAGEDWDTNSNFDSSTNYRFQPTVAGYYFLNVSVRADITGNVLLQANIFKNGGAITYGGAFLNTSSNQAIASTTSLVYANGTTDYFEFYVYSASAGNTLASSGNCFFTGFLARAA